MFEMDSVPWRNCFLVSHVWTVETKKYNKVEVTQTAQINNQIDRILRFWCLHMQVDIDPFQNRQSRLLEQWNESFSIYFLDAYFVYNVRVTLKKLSFYFLLVNTWIYTYIDVFIAFNSFAWKIFVAYVQIF